VYAKRDIAVGEELTFDYNYSSNYERDGFKIQAQKVDWMQDQQRAHQVRKKTLAEQVVAQSDSDHDDAHHPVATVRKKKSRRK
jgi:SET domain-containing protein